ANNDILAEASFTEFLPKLGLAYDINELTTISAVYQRGYRSGFTGSDAANNGAIYTVDPEYADSFELGFKTRSDDGRWNFGATGFFTRYTDQQIAQSGTRQVAGATVPFARTLNAGESTSIGLELEGQYDFGNGLSVFGSVGLLRTEFDTLVVNGVDLSGNEFPEAPSLTASLGFAYNHDSGFFATANAAYTDSFFSNGSITNDPTQFLSHYWVVNASAGFERDHVKATVFVDNVFDEEYITGITRGGAEASLGAERRMGAEVRVSF
ncbi:MAG: TonB-dependent receptor, partial [Pseudomonadota bacterium]